jgi:hypothetical protein
LFSTITEPTSSSSCAFSVTFSSISTIFPWPKLGMSCYLSLRLIDCKDCRDILNYLDPLHFFFSLLTNVRFFPRLFCCIK